MLSYKSLRFRVFFFRWQKRKWSSQKIEITYSFTSNVCLFEMKWKTRKMKKWTRHYAHTQTNNFLTHKLINCRVRALRPKTDFVCISCITEECMAWDTNETWKFSSSRYESAIMIVSIVRPNVISCTESISIYLHFWTVFVRSFYRKNRSQLHVFDCPYSNWVPVWVFKPLQINCHRWSYFYFHECAPVMSVSF